MFIALKMLLFGLKGKSRFSIFPPKKFYNINCRSFLCFLSFDMSTFLHPPPLTAHSPLPFISVMLSFLSFLHLFLICVQLFLSFLNSFLSFLHLFLLYVHLYYAAFSEPMLQCLFLTLDKPIYLHLSTASTYIT